MTKLLASIFISAFLLLPPALQAKNTFHPGSVIKNFGKVASISSDMPIPAGTEFKVSFDIGKQADAGALNRNLASVARFINMHAENGVELSNLKLAVVVHGSATFDLLTQTTYQTKAKTDKTNANAPLVQALLDNQVKIILCGQSATYHGVAKKDLLPGVKMALSAMTAHALLQQDGYSLNPF